MSTRPIIATAGQEAHMRACVEKIRVERGLSLSALSILLIGSTRLLDFQRGAPLTQMLLTRVLIGLKAQGLLLTRDALLGPADVPQRRVPDEAEAVRDTRAYWVADEAPSNRVPDEAETVKPSDPLDVCVECLTKALGNLLDVSQQLTTTFGVLVEALTPASQTSAVRLRPMIRRDSADAPAREA